MPASYRREVEYNRNRPSRVNPSVDVEQAILDAEVSEVSEVGEGIDGEGYRHVLAPESF